jgi:hypothetical protein
MVAEKEFIFEYKATGDLKLLYEFLESRDLLYFYLW